MFERMISAALNHLLQGEAWARERLRPHAGSQALIKAGVADVFLVVNSSGLFETGSAAQDIAVTIILPNDAPFRLLTERGSIFQAAKLSGSADFAETLAFVFRNLRWDIEADLARVVGDIPARRLEMLRRGLVEKTAQASSRLFLNLAEYAREESSYLVPPHEVEAFGRAVGELRDELAQLEKRLDRL